MCSQYDVPITHELDLVIEDVDPAVAFMLVEHGIKPWKNKGPV